jgi:hypothetical protein
MKFILTLPFLLFYISGHAQIFPELIGKYFNNINELPELSKCIKLEAKANSCGAVCYALQDSTNFNIIIIASQENTDITKVISDFVMIEANFIQQRFFIQIGSDETRRGIQKHAFVIAIEQERPDFRPDKNGLYPSRTKESVRIIKAWTFDCVNKRLRKISVKNLHRIHEGYYRG